MNLYAWNDFWLRFTGSPALVPPTSGFDDDYQQYVDSVSVRFDPVDRPADTEDRVYWSKRPLSVSNYATDGTLADTITGSVSEVLSITGLPADTDIHLFAIRYVTSTGQPYSPETTCWEFARTARKIAATPANHSATFSTSGDEWADWFESAPTLSMVQRTADPDGSGGVAISPRAGGPTGVYEGNKYYGKTPLAPDYNWEISIKYSLDDEYVGNEANSRPVYLTFIASSGQQHLVGLQPWRGHNAWPETNPSVPAGWSYGDSGTQRLVPFATRANYLAPTYDPTTEFIPWRTDLTRTVSVESEVRIAYTASTKTVVVYHGLSGSATTEVYRLDDSESSLSDMQKTPASQHYPFGVRAEMFWTLFSANVVNIHDVGLSSACPYAYAEWVPGWGHWASGNYHVPGKYDGNLGVNIDDPDHTLSTLGWYQPYHTAADITPWHGPANRWTTKLFAGYTAPVNQTAQTAAYPLTDVDPFKGMAYPYWTARGDSGESAYQTGTFTAKTPPIDVPAGQRPVSVVFRGIQRAGTLKARILDQDDAALTEWQTVNAVEGAASVTIPFTTATSVRAEIEIVYDGSDVKAYYLDEAEEEQEVVYKYILADMPNLSQMDTTISDCPSLFVGYGVYFTGVPEITVYDRTGTTLITIRRK